MANEPLPGALMQAGNHAQLHQKQDGHEERKERLLVRCPRCETTGCRLRVEIDHLQPDKPLCHRTNLERRRLHEKEKNGYTSGRSAREEKENYQQEGEHDTAKDQPAVGTMTLDTRTAPRKVALLAFTAKEIGRGVQAGENTECSRFHRSIRRRLLLKLRPRAISIRANDCLVKRRGCGLISPISGRDRRKSTRTLESFHARLLARDTPRPRFRCVRVDAAGRTSASLG